jgi:hypothetical protein
LVRGPHARRGERVGASRARPTSPSGISQISIFLSGDEVVFLLQGDAPEESHRMWLDDPVNSTLLEPWLPLFDGPLHRAPEIVSWEIG